MENLWIDQSSSLDNTFISAAIIFLVCFISLFLLRPQKGRKDKSQKEGIKTLLALLLIMSSAFLIYHSYNGISRHIERHFGIESFVSETTPYCTPFSRIVDTTAQWQEGEHWFQGKLVVEKRGGKCEIAVTAFENPQSKLLQQAESTILTSDS